MSPRLPQTLRRSAAKLGLLVFGFLLAVILLEIGLSIASVFVGGRAVESIGSTGRTILTLGDSHTYGVFLEADESYPGRLEALLNEGEGAPDHVVNLGLPGTNSSEIATRLPGWLETYHPAAIVVCVGVNNIWNRSDTRGEWADETAPGLLDRLRVVRLARLMSAHYLQPPPGATLRPEIERVVLGGEEKGVEFREADTGELLIRHHGDFARRVPLDRAQAILKRDLGRILALAQAAGTELVLLTYAEYPVSGEPDADQVNHRTTNESLRAFAREHGLRLADAAPRIRHAIEASGHPAKRYFLRDRFHPSADGYAQIAPLLAALLDE